MFVVILQRCEYRGSLNTSRLRQFWWKFSAVSAVVGSLGVIAGKVRTCGGFISKRDEPDLKLWQRCALRRFAKRVGP